MAKTDLKKLSMAELQAEIERRKNAVSGAVRKLERRRKTLSTTLNRVTKQIADIDKEIAELTGEAPKAAAPNRKRGPKKGTKRAAKSSTKKASRRGRTGKRPSNKVSLQEAITAVLDTKEPKKVANIVKDVLASGYKTSSPNFRTIVSQTLSKNDEFVSVARGMYVKK